MYEKCVCVRVRVWESSQSRTVVSLEGVCVNCPLANLCLLSTHTHTHTYIYIYIYIIIYKHILCGPADDPGKLMMLSTCLTHTHSFSVAGFWVSSPYSIALNDLLRRRTSGTLYTEDHSGVLDCLAATDTLIEWQRFLIPHTSLCIHIHRSHSLLYTYILSYGCQQHINMSFSDIGDTHCIIHPCI